MTTAVTVNISPSLHVNAHKRRKKGLWNALTLALTSPFHQKLPIYFLHKNCLTLCQWQIAWMQLVCHCCRPNALHVRVRVVVRCASHSQNCYCFHVYVTRDRASMSVLVSRAFQYNGISSSSVCFHDGLCYGNNNKRIKKITPKDEKRKAKNPKTEKKQNKKSELHI